MRKLEKEYGEDAGHFPSHDYYRDSRSAFGSRYYAPTEPTRGRSGWVLLAVITAVLVYVAKRFMLGQ